MNDVFYHHPDDKGVLEHETPDLTGEVLSDDEVEIDLSEVDESEPPA